MPGIKFTVVDHRQRPKLGYFGLKQAYAPLLVSLDEQYPLALRAAGSDYRRDLVVVNDGRVERDLLLTTTLHATTGEGVSHDAIAVVVGPDSAVRHPVEVRLPAQPGPYLLRTVATEDGEEVARSEWWANVVEPVFSPAVASCFSESRYAHPILDAFGDVPGVEFTIVDETNRHPQDPRGVSG